MGAFRDLTGQKFGKLTVVSLYESRGGHVYWNCLCDCGSGKIVRGSHLTSNHTASCGCGGKHKTHGDTRSRLYRTWCNMRQRCHNKNVKCYPLYGGRGITVCDEWRNDFEAFRCWALSNGYQDNLTIDRKDNNGSYSPNNCRWATHKDQANNTRKTRFLTYNGETHSVSEWARLLGIKQSTLNMRLNKYNWSVEEALRKGAIKYGTK